MLESKLRIKTSTDPGQYPSRLFDLILFLGVPAHFRAAVEDDDERFIHKVKSENGSPVASARG